MGGVCSPVIEKELLRIAHMIQDMRDRGVEVLRYNIMDDGQAFLNSEVIKDLLVKTGGTDFLPAVVVDGKVMSQNDYPTDLELAKWAGFSWGDLEIYAEREKREKTVLFTPGGGGCDSCS